MASYQLRCQMLVKLPIEEVFEVFQDPYNLIKITPPSMDFKVTNEKSVEMRKGELIHYLFRMLGLPLTWTTLISDYAPPFRFIDEQLKGPYTRWHHLHRFKDTVHGVEVSDIVDYTLPLGPLGLLGQPIVKPQLLEIFRFRQQALSKMWGGAESTDPQIYPVG